MSEFSFLDPAIEIAAGEPRFEMIAAKLRAGGMRPYGASTSLDFGAPDPLLIDIATAGRAALEGLAEAVTGPLARPVVLIDLSSLDFPLSDDIIILRRDEDLASLKSRLAALSRRTGRAAEAELRLETARALGAELPAPDLHTPPALLYLGDGSALFLALQGPLKRRGIDVTAAISTETARLYMSERRFTAALVDLGSLHTGRIATTRWITERHGLGALPILALSVPDEETTDLQAAVMALATEVIDAGDDPARIVSAVDARLRRLAASAPAMPEPSDAPDITDPATGLFNRNFIEDHLARQMDQAAARAEPMCVVTFRMDVNVRGALAPQASLANIIRAQIRDADCAASLEPGIFVISLPATPYRGAVQLAERICEYAARTTTLASGAFGWRAVEKRAFHTPQTLLGAGLIGPLMRPRIAA